eukprot:16413089-Heterocapsa_arctica.AAC.1
MPVLSESDRGSGDDMMAATSETVQRSDLSESTTRCTATTALTSETAPRSDLSAATVGNNATEVYDAIEAATDVHGPTDAGTSE